ncbi:DUF742 domain-containing protein [Saccharopolyspora rhizosphaerae]|uniref:DUF742 domain-containing protein n=1 Tax=Saccharopolyspora rhizosphaerae TaxID=2492662 RepID=A0A426JW28_9PSEU|nr:DUF742 domain-containing protein [Saccharopolyspora rhizosphaerae]RRO17347.1 DUF742 domain-containing protein [Saccharopolyspora rhizosphaerae]
MNAGSEPSWDGDLFRLYNKRLSAESWQDDFVDDTRSGQEGDSVGGYDRALFGGPGADLFGSGGYGDAPSGAQGAQQQNAWGQDSRASQENWGSQDRGAPTPRPRSDGGPPSVSMPSISQSMSPISQSMPSISGSMPAIPPMDDGEAEDSGGSLVRPYARTRGRTRTDYDLAIETLVSTSERGRNQATQSRPEHRSISELCLEARSVAEVAAHLRLPLGVVRVLIGDMADTGLVLIHDSGMVVGDRPSMEFLERVLSGLRRL